MSTTTPVVKKRHFTSAIVMPTLAVLLPLVISLLSFIFLHMHDEAMNAVKEERSLRDKMELRVHDLESIADSNKSRITVIEAQSGYIKQLLEEVRKDVGYIKDNMKKP